MAYFRRAEPRVRYGMLLRMTGRNAEARIVFNELLLQMKRAPKYLRETRAEWLSIAESNCRIEAQRRRTVLVQLPNFCSTAEIWLA